MKKISEMERKFILILALAVGLAAKATVVTTISNVSDFQALATSVNRGENYSGVTVTLATDLDLSEVSWMPIGTTTHPFVGTFDGQGHTISNLSVNVDGANTGNVAGLFGKIDAGGKVKDVNISSGTIVLNSLTGEVNCAVGSIAGYNDGTIVGCSNTAEVRGNWNNASVGGIAGEDGGTGVIQNCYNIGEVYTGDSYTGNKLGGIVGNNNKTVQNCFVKASISPVGSFGKICGDNGGTVTGCFYMNGTSDDYPAVVTLANASDNSSTISGNTGSGKNVLLNGRTLFADGNWNTLCLPFDIPAGAEGYSPIAGAKVKTLSSSSFSVGTLTLTFEDATSIEAGKPYLVKWDTPITGNLPNPVFTNVTMSSGTTDVTTTSINFVGTFAPLSYTTENRSVLFLGSGSKLYYPNGNATTTINAFRAYFTLNGITAGDPVNGVKAFMLDFDGEDDPDGIGAMLNDRGEMMNDTWFDLSGRKLSGKPTQRGIYIVNGKKVAFK